MNRQLLPECHPSRLMSYKYNCDHARAEKRSGPVSVAAGEKDAAKPGVLLTAMTQWLSCISTYANHSISTPPAYFPCLVVLLAVGAGVVGGRVR